MYVVNGAYNLAPQEFIDYINECVEAQNDSKYKTIPPFEESGKKIDIISGVSVTFETNDAGKISKIEYSWVGTYSDTISVIGLLMGITIGSLTPETDQDAILEELNMMSMEKSSYDTYSEANGSTFWYSSVEYAKYNFLTITPNRS